LKTGEMMVASAQVIAHRTGCMAFAGPTPSVRDHEFTLMGQEKSEAAAESARAMATQMMTMNSQLGARAAKQMLEGAPAMMSLAASRTPGQAIRRQAKLVRTMARSAGVTSQLSGSAARLAQRGVKPIHFRATRNAKRLGKRY
jgi:hypothetical protein